MTYTQYTTHQIYLACLCPLRNQYFYQYSVSTTYLCCFCSSIKTHLLFILSPLYVLLYNHLCSSKSIFHFICTLHCIFDVRFFQTLCQMCSCVTLLRYNLCLMCRCIAINNVFYGNIWYVLLNILVYLILKFDTKVNCVSVKTCWTVLRTWTCFNCEKWFNDLDPFVLSWY